MVTPYFQNAHATVYCGDAREVLSAVEPASAHLLLTDPPYGMNYRSWAGERIRGDRAREAQPLLAATLPEVDRILVKPAHAYIFCHYGSYPGFFELVRATWPVKSALVWWKDRGGPGDLQASYARDYELALFAHVGGRRRLRGKREGSVFKVPPVPYQHRIHPTQKPVELLRRLLVKSTDAGETVIDPFGGSLATAEAAMLEGRRAVVVEAEEQYCEAGARRLEALRGRLERFDRTSKE